jgi:hypothetical protein
VITRSSLAATLLAAWSVTIAAAPVPFKPFERGEQSRIERLRQVVVRTESDWKTLARQRGPAVAGTQRVDFARSMIVGVFLGSRPTAGYGVEITGIDRNDAEMIVTWRERKPAADDMVAQVVTAPYLLVVVDTFAGAVKFARDERDRVHADAVGSGISRQ